MRPLYLHMFPPAVAPSLALVGLSWKAIRPPQFQLQGQLFARLLAGAAAPLLSAEPGSDHGYDVVSHEGIDPTRAATSTTSRR